MPEMGSDKQRTRKLRFRAVFTEDALSADSLETAERLFARWLIRDFLAGDREALDLALGLASGPGREDSEGTAPACPVRRTGRTGRTHPT